MLSYHMSLLATHHSDAFGAHDHSQCARAAMEKAEALIAERGLRLTPVRRRTLEILQISRRALGAYEVLEQLSAEGFGHQPPVAYRALDFLVENGLAHRVQRLNAFAACMCPDHDHAPVFLICRECKAVAELPGDAVQAALSVQAGEVGFAVERSSIEAQGLCPACQSAADL